MSRRQRHLPLAPSVENVELLQRVTDRAHIVPQSVLTARIINGQYVQLELVERDSHGKPIVDWRRGVVHTYTKRVRIPRGHPWSHSARKAAR